MTQKVRVDYQVREGLWKNVASGETLARFLRGVQEEADQGQKAVSSYLPDLCCSQRQSLGPQA